MSAILSIFAGPVWGFVRAFWKPIAIALAVLTIFGYVHHMGYVAAEKKAAVTISKANAERDSARAGLKTTEDAFAALRKENDRIIAQQADAAKQAALTDKATATKVAQIRAQVAKGNTELERLRSLIQQQAVPQ